MVTFIRAVCAEDSEMSDDPTGDIFGTLVFWPLMFTAFCVGTCGGTLFIVGAVAVMILAFVG
jgi:hypothetical protein